MTKTLKNLREDKELTVPEVIVNLKIEKQTLYNYENRGLPSRRGCRSPSSPNELRIALSKIYEVSEEDLKEASKNTEKEWLSKHPKIAEIAKIKPINYEKDISYIIKGMSNREGKISLKRFLDFVKICNEFEKPLEQDVIKNMLENFKMSS